MRRSGDIPWGQWRLGLVIFIGMMIFVWASIRGGTAIFERREELRAHFGNVNGLTQGSPIWFRGVEVGSVKGLDIRQEADTSYIEVTLSVQRDVVPALHRDAVAVISAINFFGEKFVDLRAGTPGSGPFDPEQVISSREPTDFDVLLRRGEVALERVATMAEDLQVVTTRLREGRGSLGILLNERRMHDDLAALIQQSHELAASLDASQRRTSAALTSAAVELDTLLARMNRGQGTLGRMARDEALYESLAGAAASADTTLGRVAAGEGSAGLMTTDDRAYREFTLTLQRLNQLLADIQKDPKKYFKFSVF